MDQLTRLPPGQRELSEFPRFGHTRYAERMPPSEGEIALDLSADAESSARLSADDLTLLPRVEQTSDFHCVTTWSRRSLRWGGYRFRDFYEAIVVPRVRPEPSSRFVVFRCLDSYATSLLLDDVLADDVLLADTLDGKPLPIKHGTPLRLIAPAQYGYKNPKHLCGIEVRHQVRLSRSVTSRFMDHPRARVAFEERGVGLPGWLLRYAYRPLIKRTIRKLQRALDDESLEM